MGVHQLGRSGDRSRRKKPFQVGEAVETGVEIIGRLPVLAST